MSDSSPRWPGADGSPGLDFAPRRRNVAAAAEAAEPSGGGAGRPTPPPFDPLQQQSAPRAAATSVQMPTRPGVDEEPAAGAKVDQDQAKAAPEEPRQPAPQESAAAWAWQPLDAESKGRPPARSADSAVVADDATALRPAPEAAAAAGGAIAGAAARAASQARKEPLHRPTPSHTTATPSAATRPAGTKRTRKARLRLARLDPWSVMKTTFLFSIAFGIMMLVVAWVLWTVLAGSGALDSLNQFMTTLIGNQGDAPFRIEDYINAPRVLGAAALLAAIDVVILTAVATLFAFLYNLAATVIGGLEVTLAED